MTAYQVVVLFRFEPSRDGLDAEWMRQVIPDMLADYLHEWEFDGLDVAVELAEQKAEPEIPRGLVSMDVPPPQPSDHQGPPEDYDG